MLLSSIAIVSFLLFISTPPVLSQSQPYTKNTVFQGGNFFQGFNWETFDDPTNGRVNFVDMQTAQKSNLSYADDDVFIMRADAYQVVPPAPYGRGRDSVRITSHNSWGDSVLVLDIAHMPEGCSTWPAYWTTSKTGHWPYGGEVDILEGVNLNNANLASLHTTPNCTMPQTRNQTGQVVTTNCDSAVNYNQGCGVVSTTPNTYGSGFNSIGGGWVVTSRSANAISHWFWPRNAPNVPNEIRHATCTDSIIPGLDWGTPTATFVWDTCDYPSHFNDHEIIFDLTFCGDWAGSAFATAGCGAGTCEDLVNNHPEAFREAYWQLNSLAVYTL